MDHCSGYHQPGGPFPIDADGRLAGSAAFFGVGGSGMVLAGVGSLEKKTVLGDFVPETGSSERFSAFIGPTVLNDVGQMVFQTTYRFANSVSISGGGLRFSDDTLVNTSIELLPTDVESPDGAGQYGAFEEWSISDTGRVALTGRLFNENQNGNEGITEANGGRVKVQTGDSLWTIVAAEGTLLPEFPANETVETVIGSLRPFDSGFYGVTLNDSGQVAFGATIYDRVPATGATPPPARTTSSSTVLVLRGSTSDLLAANSQTSSPRATAPRLSTTHAGSSPD